LTTDTGRQTRAPPHDLTASPAATFCRLLPPNPLQPQTLHRWGNPDFGAYVDQLQQQADEALAQSPGQLEAAKVIVQQVVQLELDFWNMAYAGDTPGSQ
jgi:hypothetical protein